MLKNLSVLLGIFGHTLPAFHPCSDLVILMQVYRRSAATLCHAGLTQVRSQLHCLPLSNIVYPSLNGKVEGRKSHKGKVSVKLMASTCEAESLSVKATGVVCSTKEDAVYLG